MNLSPEPASRPELLVPPLDATLQLFPEEVLTLAQGGHDAQYLHVLLVEDSAADALLLRTTLESARSVTFQVTHVERLSEALSRVAQERFDVVLLDLSLPDSSGLDTVTRLHAQAPRLPIVILTGFDDETLAVEAVHAGAQDYLVKGQIEGRMLVRAIRYAIERQRADDALRQRDWLDVTLASIGDAVIATDTSGIIRFLNPVAARLTDWTVQEAYGRHIDTVFRILNEETRQPVETPVACVLREGTIISLANYTALVTRDGREVPIDDSAAPIRSSDGTLHGVVLVFRDISERKHLEEQLRQAQKMEAIGTLAGDIAHDFNNVLAAMLGYTELAMLDVPSSSLLYSRLQAVLTAGQRAKDLVQQILAFSRPTQMARHPLQLHMLIKEALTLLRASLPSTIEIRHHLSPDAGAVLADASQMHQVLLNLCTNAEYAMRETGGILEIRLEAAEVDAASTPAHANLTPGSYVRLTVRDTGPGIPPDVLARVFEPFFTTKGPGEGTGMGLALVHGLVASHEGAITVASVPGQGATFEVYLPRVAASPATDAPHAEPLPRGQGHILLVDDEAAVAHVGQVVLEHLGYRVSVCLSSLEALETFRAAPQRYDLVITDQTMPRLSGDALIRALRSVRPDIPVILCTGFSHTMDAETAEALNIDAFLTKPWSAHELASTIQQVLARKG